VKVTKEKEENRQAFLRIEAEPADMEKYFALAYKHLVTRARVPGFRKGKTPRPILERYVGKEGMLQEALEHLIPEMTQQAVKEQGLEMIAQPSIDLETVEPVVFKAAVPLKPVVTLGDYRAIRLKPEPVEITEENVNNVMTELERQHTSWEPVEREVQFNDMVSMDIESTVEDKPFLNQKGVQYEVAAGRPFPVPGFAEQLAGMKGGEEKEFKLTLPKDYNRAELAEKEVTFKVKVSEVKQPKKPEVNDEFAGLVDPELKTLAALRERITTNLKERAETRTREEFEEKVIDAAVEKCQADYPAIMVEDEIDRELEQQARWLQANGTAVEDYLKQINKSPEQLREELRPLAVKRVVRTLVLEQMADAEQAEASDEEITAELQRLGQASYKEAAQVEQFVASPTARNSMRRAIRHRKTVEKLAEYAKSGPTIEIARS